MPAKTAAWLVVSFAVAQVVPPTGLIEGKVVKALSGEPVRRAELTLHNGRAGTRATTESDSDGKFLFKNLAPGAYALTGAKAGFLRRHYNPRPVESSMGGTILTLTAGQQIKDLTFALTPQGSISGKIVDESGEPVMRATVVPYRRGGLGTPVHTMNYTNDAGQFRLAGLPAGKYILRVHQMGDSRDLSPGPNPDDNFEEAFVPTYYPGVPEESQAAVLDLAAGQEINGAQIHLRKSRVFRIRGRLTGVDPAILAGPLRPSLALFPRQSRPSMIMVGSNGALVKPDGTFELFNVAPGDYNLVATDPNAGPFRGPIGRTPVVVAGQSVNGVVVHNGGPLTLSGVIKVEGSPKLKVLSTVRLISEATGLQVYASGPVKDGNAFKIDHLSRDKYFVELSPLPDGMYLKNIHPIDLTTGDATLDILISPTAGSISGRVLVGDEPFPGAGVVLVPDPFTGIPAVTARTTSTDQQGRYVLPNLAPGDYLLYAIDQPVSTMYLDAGVLEPYEKSSKKVKIGESGRESAELRISKSN